MIFTDGVHLISDESLDQLHRFARGIGLKREWFQDHPKHPHYDIWGTKLKAALTAGALKVTSRQLIRIIRGPKPR